MNVALRIDTVGIVIDEIREMAEVRLAAVFEGENLTPFDILGVRAAEYGRWLTIQVDILRNAGRGTDGRVDHFINELATQFQSAVVEWVRDNT